MKTSFIALAVLFFVACSFSANGNDTPSIMKTFKIKDAGELVVKTSGGSIKVEGSNSGEVEVNAYVRKNGTLVKPESKELEEILKGFDLLIEKQGNSVHAIVRRVEQGMPWKRVSISFHVKTPKEISCDLKTSGGSINIAQLEGSQMLKTSGGSLKINNVNGRVDGRTSGGSIKVNNQQGPADLHTSGGSISVSNSDGDVIARTSGGSIRLENIAGSMNASTSGGSIKINGTADKVKASTSGGGINVNVSELSEALELRTSGGSINASIPDNLGLDLDLRAGRVNAPVKNFTGEAKKNRVSGSMNGGGIPVTMTTSGGSINVDFQ